MTGIARIALARPSLVVDAKEITEAWGRSPRGVERLRLPAWDEDGTTLAIDAGREALGRESGAALRTLVLAGPVEGAVVAEALGARHARLVAPSGPLAGLDALTAGLAAAPPALVVAAAIPESPVGSDARLEEGAGAVGLLATEEGALREVASVHVARASPPGELDAGAILAEALERFAAPPEPPVFAAGVAAGPRPVRPAADVRKEWGELSGGVGALAQLAESARAGLAPGAWCLVGGADRERASLLALQAAGHVEVVPPAERARRVGPLRALEESRALASSEPDAPMGAYVPAGTWVEDLPARLRLVAQRCARCGRVQYPPRGACLDCRAREFQEVELARTAQVHAATRIGRGGAPSEFASEQTHTGAYWVGVVEWPEQKVRVTARLAGYDEHGPALGDSVRAVVRRLFEQEGAARYGVKFEAS
jgi:uncharacterized OB-fold protein